ncbi:hypothetical protein NVP1121O_037 [Vibrio phage 1.121.O._10N.286.46.C4]|nr:hypothetical protein NVP1121O_037 [Vibrio phage 1.121.O._10N.286.46.C4]
MQMVVQKDEKELTMTSVDLLQVINSYRLKDGKSEMRHSNFMQKIRDEFEEEALLKFQHSYQGVDNAATICYKLPKEECMIMAMRESKYVRRQTVDYIKSLEKKCNQLQLPDFSNPAEAARAWAEQYEATQLALVEKAKIEEYSERQTKYIGVLEDQHAKGITCPQFAKELNGVNVQQVQKFLSTEKNWMRKDRGGWNATAYSRDKYLSVKYVEGHDGVSRPTCYLTEKGAALLYKYYCKQELPMKKTWNGSLTPQKYLPIIGE